MVEFLSPNEQRVQRIVDAVRALQALVPVEETAANIADKDHPINTFNKAEGRRVWDTTNKRELRASGGGATDDWEVVDGSAQVTPA